jgi:hypothetical protein
MKITVLLLVLGNSEKKYFGYSIEISRDCQYAWDFFLFTNTAIKFFFDIDRRSRDCHGKHCLFSTDII